MEEWLKILLIILGSIVALLVIACIIANIIVPNLLLKNFFTRRTKPKQKVYNNLDNEINKEWKPYINDIFANLEYMNSLKLEDIYITSFDGLKLHANLYPSVNKTNNYIILLHGFQGNRFQDFTAQTKYYHDDYNLLFVDIRSHCESEGTIISFGINENLDLVQWEEYLHNRFGNEINLFIHGVSMGCTTALMASDKLHNVQGIIADCGFTSCYDIVRVFGDRIIKNTSWMLIGSVRSKMLKVGGFDIKKEDTRKSLKVSKIPVIFFHGTNDKVVPLYMTQENYNACNSDKELIIFEGVGHALSSFEKQEEYKEKVLNFLNKNKVY